MTIIDADFTSVQTAAIAALGKVFFVPPANTVILTVGTDVASLDAAFSGIARWGIPADSIVQIKIPAGTTSLSAPTSINHPYGARIQVLGANTVTTTASAAGSITGSSGAWSVPLTVASATGIAVNDFVLIRNVSGTGAYKLFAGICKVSGVSGTTVTVVNTAKNAAWPSATLSAADLTVIKSIISYSGCDGLQINGPLGSIDKIAIVGNKTSGTIGLIGQRMAEGSKNKAYVYLGTSVGIAGFGDGGVYAQYSGTIDAAYLCVADCLVYNVLAQHGGSVMLNDGISSGCAQAGVAASNSGDVSFERGTACGNGTYGLYPFSGGTVLARDGYVWANVSDGARASYGGVLRADNLDSQYNGSNGFFCVGAQMVLPEAVASHNTGVGFYVEGGGSLYANDATATSNGSYGFYADGGVLDCPTAIASSNTLAGFSAVNNGTILAAGANGSGNTSYSFSATTGGMIRASSGTANSIYVANGGVIDTTSVSGSPTVTIGQEGLIIDSTVQRGSVLLSSGSSIAIGATNTAALNIDKSAAVYQRLAKGGTLKALYGVDDGNTLVGGAANGDFVLRAEGAMWFAAGGSSERGFIDANGNAALGRDSLATNASDGFFYLPASAGTPTGTPTAKSGRVPIEIDTSNSKLWAYIGGSWKSVTLS